MLAARLRKNLARLAPIFRRDETTAFRLYDRDIPERPWSLDLYGDHVLATEWVTPVALRRDLGARDAERADVERAVVEVVAPSQIHWRQRQRHRSVEREAAGHPNHEFEVKEHGLTLLVNLDDYLDTGLFLDHRPARMRVATEARGKRLLNLFCYTGAFTVHAAAAGARRTVSVDLSPTYLAWAERNLERNGLTGSAHSLQRADVFAFLRACRETFDVVVLDPPTVSRAAKGRSFEIQRMQRELFELCLARLDAGGLLFFSTNDRQFTLDPGVPSTVQVKEVTRETTPVDFRAPGHRAWMFRKS